MVITVVTFPTGDNNYEQMVELIKGSVSKYQAAASAGLMRKNYLLTEDGKTAGAIYLWESKEKLNYSLTKIGVNISRIVMALIQKLSILIRL